jgi:DNA topoisomerase-1
VRKSDEDHYNTVKALHNDIEKIRRKYESDWKDVDDRTKQHSVALYLIDTFTIKAGGRRDVKTFGCCSLQLKHVTLTPANTEVSLNFPGKRSVPYKNTKSVPDEVFTNLQQFTQDKSEGDKIFDKINCSTLNQYLRKIAGKDVYVSSKIIRTYKACVEFEKKLEEYSKQDGDKKEQYKNALRDVTALLNYKKDNLDSAQDHFLDPRITVAWCKRFNVPINVVYSKGRIMKFAWAMKTTSDYKFAEYI